MHIRVGNPAAADGQKEQCLPQDTWDASASPQSFSFGCIVLETLGLHISGSACYISEAESLLLVPYLSFGLMQI